MDMCRLSSMGSHAARIDFGVLPASGREAYQQYVALNEDFGLERLDGVDAEAAWDESLGTLVVLHDDAVLGMNVSFQDPDIDRYRRDLALQLAAHALSSTQQGREQQEQGEGTALITGN
jgi:hypothetical protein